MSIMLFQTGNISNSYLNNDACKICCKKMPYPNVSDKELDQYSLCIFDLRHSSNNVSHKAANSKVLKWQSSNCQLMAHCQLQSFR